MTLDEQHGGKRTELLRASRKRSIEGREGGMLCARRHVQGVVKVHASFVPRQRIQERVETVGPEIRQAEQQAKPFGDLPASAVVRAEHPYQLLHHGRRRREALASAKQRKGGPVLLPIVLQQVAREDIGIQGDHPRRPARFRAFSIAPIRRLVSLSLSFLRPFLYRHPATSSTVDGSIPDAGFILISSPTVVTTSSVPAVIRCACRIDFGMTTSPLLETLTVSIRLPFVRRTVRRT